MYNHYVSIKKDCIEVKEQYLFVCVCTYVCTYVCVHGCLCLEEKQFLKFYLELFSIFLSPPAP